MRGIWICMLATTLLFACNNTGKVGDKIDQKNNPNKSRFKVDTTIQMVDTISLNTADTAFIVKNKLINEDIGDKQKEYSIDIYFSNVAWPKLNFKNAIGADLFLVDDLDGDGKPELLLRPDWFSSCWASINLYSLKEKQWKLIKKDSMYFCADEYPLSKRVIKTQKGYALLTDSLADDKFVILKKEIKF